MQLNALAAIMALPGQPELDCAAGLYQDLHLDRMTEDETEEALRDLRDVMLLPGHPGLETAVRMHAYLAGQAAAGRKRGEAFAHVVLALNSWRSRIWSLLH